MTRRGTVHKGRAAVLAAVLAAAPAAVPVGAAMGMMAGQGAAWAQTGQTGAGPAAAAIATNADGLPQWRYTSINDFAGVITADDARALDAALIALAHETGVQGTVVTLPQRAPLAHEGESLEDFTARLFNSWGVGDKSRNDGFMVLMSAEPGEARIQLGRAYGASAELRAEDIMSRVMLPAFREDQPSRALRAGTVAVIDQIGRPVAAGAAVASPDSGHSSGDRIAAGIFGLIAAGMGVAIWRDRRRRNRCPQCGHVGLVDGAATPLREDREGGGWITRSNTVARRCPNCGWETVLTLPMASVNYYDRHGALERSVRMPASSRPGSGSSGFGGGSTGGRGASGRW